MIMDSTACALITVNLFPPTAMSMTKLGDNLMRVPKLDASGSNWVVYKDQFLWAVDARGLLHHINGSSWEPRKPSIMTKTVTGANGKEREEDDLDADDKKQLSECRNELKTWKLGEAVVKQQIAVTIPDSLFMKIQGK